MLEKTSIKMSVMIKKIIFAFAALAIILTGCKKDGATGAVDSTYFTAKIDGVEKSFTSTDARWVDGGNYLEITGSNGGTEWIKLTIMSETTRVPSGQYTLDDLSGFNILAIYSLTRDNQQLNVAATRNTYAPEDALNLNLSKVNNSMVEGSFSGALVRVEGLKTLQTINLTDGKFKTTIKPN